jgi:hypothetical protein
MYFVTWDHQQAERNQALSDGALREGFHYRPRMARIQRSTSGFWRHPADVYFYLVFGFGFLLLILLLVLPKK